MAATLMSKSNQYFESLNPLAKKIGQDKENLQRRYGQEAWNKLTHDQQEDLLNKFFVDVGIAEKYASGSSAVSDEERPDCFPKLIIPSGEKICVDFDNDQGWTWRDEHSGPFSWMTRSQQDLAMYEDEDEGIEDDGSDTNKNGENSNKSTPVGTPKRPVRKSNKSQSPRTDQKGNLAYKPEKSIWDSPFLAADRGLDSAYPSSHSSDQSKGSDESDHGDIINKFGMAAAFSNAVREAEQAERHSTSACSDNPQPESLPAEVEGIQLTVLDQPKSRKKSEPSPDRSSSSATLDLHGYTASPSRDSISSSGSGRSSHNKKKSSIKSGSSNSSKDKRWKPSRTEKKPEAERALMSELSVSVGSSIGADDAARSQISPVFIADPGESSTDFNVNVSNNAKFLFQDMKRERPTTAPPPPPCVPPPPPPAPRRDISLLSADSGQFSTPSSGQVNFAMDDATNHGYDDDCEELDDWKVDLFSSNEGDDPDAPKTGFDFLDNW